MHVDLEIITAEQYFEKTDREIDYEEDDSSKVSYEQADLLQRILTTECSIHVLRSVTGLCGSLVDSMADIRTSLIWEYEEKFEEYVLYRDFY